MLKILILLIFVTNVELVKSVDWVALQKNKPLPELPSDICEVGKYYKYKCNVCECVPPGIHICGTLSCMGDPHRTGDYANTGCVAGTFFHEWCNLCECYDGLHVECTNKVCS